METATTQPVKAFDYRAAANTVLKQLKRERDRQILAKRYGFDHGKRQTLEEIGRGFGITRERVRQIEKSALTKLRHLDLPEVKSAAQLIGSGSGIRGGPALQRRNQLLQRAENIASGILEQLAAWQVGLQIQSVRNLHGVGSGVAAISNSGRTGRVQLERRRGGCSASEKIVSAYGRIGQLYELTLNALQVLHDLLAVPCRQSSGCTLHAQSDGLRERLHY